MANYPIWSKERKEYIRSLIPNKKILFAKVRSAKKAKWEEDNEDYDIIIGYCYDDDIYYACDARLHKGYHNATFDCPEFDNKHKNEIVIGYRHIASNKTLKERIIMIPCKKLEKFCRYYRTYLKNTRDDNEPILLGIYDEKTKTIVQA